MKKNYGFTLIELMVLIAVIGIIVAVLEPLFFGDQAHYSEAERAARNAEAKAIYEPPVVEMHREAQEAEPTTKCISGYKFLISGDNVTQIKDYQNNGIGC